MTSDTSSMDRRALLRGTVTVAGVAIVLPSLASLGGCTSTPPTLAEHMDLISAVSDRIIPETDTPGALSAGVPDYIAAVFDSHLNADQQADFVAGLLALADRAENEGLTSFEAADPAQQDAVITKLAQADDDTAGKATWQQLRDMAIFGFYTSEVATQELAFEEIPGRYDGCLPLQEVGRAWLERGV